MTYSSSSALSSTVDAVENGSSNSGNSDNKVTIVPFYHSRQEEVATLFQNGLRGYDFSGDNTWKILNHWFVSDRMKKDMRDISAWFSMGDTTPTSEDDDTFQKDIHTEKASFEGLQFLMALDSSTDQVIGCVGIKRPDEHTLAKLRQVLDEGVTRDSTCELVRMSVDKSCRRRGIGKKLVRAVESFAKENGFNRVCLTTLKIATAPVGLYQSCGYSIVNEEPLIIPDPPEELAGRNSNDASLHF